MSEQLYDGTSRLYYGMVGNGETAALIGPDLAIRWLCLPRFDGTPCFASALDPHRGGQLTLSWEGTIPVETPRMEQQYVGRTNVLSTSVQTEDLTLEAVDSMPWGQHVLVRRLTVVNGGTTALGMKAAPDAAGAASKLRIRFDVQPVRSAQWSFALEEASISLDGRGSQRVVTVTEKAAAAVVGWVPGSEADTVDTYRGSGAAQTSTNGVAVSVPRLKPGEAWHGLLLLAYGSDRAEAEQRWSEVAGRLTRCPAGDPAGLQQEVQFWDDWLSRARVPATSAPDLIEAYMRSLLTLKLLTHAESGAILAAPTASFPAVPGGHDNWDYRYCWIRDGYFAARCFDEAGLHDESRAFYEFCLGLQGKDGRWRQPLYTLDGGRPEELLVDDLAGPEGEGPIRFGNAAYDQLQIDNEPSVLHGLSIHAQRTGDQDFVAAHWEAIRRAAEAMMTLWHRKENGIWEIRERRDHWIYGKALCVAGFEAAAALAEWLGHDDDARRWQAEAELIREQVITAGYCPERGAFLQTYDKNSPLDISALALVLWGVVPADDERMRSTVAALERPLGLPALALRTTEPTTDDPYWGMHDMKGGLEMDGAFARYDYGAEPFYLPTLWMARYHLRAGERQRAEQLVRLCLHNATNLGLMAEHFNPRTGRQWGNFPQAFSHEELALTILELGSGD